MEFTNFNEAIDFLRENHDDVTDRETLIDFAKQKIDEDMLLVAIHILDSIRLDEAEYYQYDYCMGACDTPESLETLEDIEQLLKDFE